MLIHNQRRGQPRCQDTSNDAENRDAIEQATTRADNCDAIKRAMARTIAMCYDADNRDGTKRLTTLKTAADNDDDSAVAMQQALKAADKN